MEHLDLFSNTPTPKIRKPFFLTAGCIYCNKAFTTFEYAARHIDRCHSREVRANHMNYPINLGCDPNLAHGKTIVVFLDKSPGEKGVAIDYEKGVAL